MTPSSVASPHLPNTSALGALVWVRPAATGSTLVVTWGLAVPVGDYWRLEVASWGVVIEPGMRAAASPGCPGATLVRVARVERCEGETRRVVLVADAHPGPPFIQAVLAEASDRAALVAEIEATRQTERVRDGTDECF